jgi:hypothetical protein
MRDQRHDIAAAPGAGTAIRGGISPVAPVLAAVTAEFAARAEKAGSIASVSEQSHLMLPSLRLSIRFDWRDERLGVGIRPAMPTSSPPDPRTAEANGAAQVFSQTRIVAALPGSKNCRSPGRPARRTGPRGHAPPRESPTSLSSASRNSDASTEPSLSFVSITRSSTRIVLLSIGALSWDAVSR